MLNTMRKNTGSWIIKVLLIAIVIVFVFWGVGTFREQRGGRVAIVNGQTITYQEWVKTYDSMIENLKLRFGGTLNEDLLEMLNVKEQALNQLINGKLLAEEARRLNFQISEKELVDAIRIIPAFQTNGVFNNRLYQRVLRHYKRTPEEFEAAQREELLINKLRTFIYQTVKISDQEALEWYQWNKASVNINYVCLKPDDYKNITPSDEEVSRYFEENKASYKTAPMIKVRYLMFDPIEYRSRVKLADEEIAAYFEENAEAFIWPKTVEASHILIKVPPDAKPEIVEERRKKAEEIMTMAKSGKDFAELAKTYSEGPSKNSGGYLGAFEKKDMVGPFADKAFSMSAGEISEPVRTRFGWHIIKVEKVNEERQKTLDEVEGEIRTKLEEQYAKEMAYNDAESVYDDSLDIDDLSQIAENRHLKVLTTDFFSRTGPETGIAEPAKFAAAAFELEIMDISDILNFEGTFFILQPIERREEKIPEFDAVKEKVKKDLIKKLKEAAAQKDAEKLLARLKNPDSENNGDLAFETTGFFTRFGAVPDIGYEQEIIETAFMLTEENPFPEKVIKGSNGFYVIRFKERKPPDIKGFEAEKTEIKKRLLKQKQVKAFSSLVTHLRSKGDISIKENFL